MTATVGERPIAVAGSRHNRAARGAETSSDRDPARGRLDNAVRGRLDRVLQLIERRPMSALELRILLRLVDGQATVPALAEALERPTTEVWVAARDLARRGFAVRRSDGPGCESVYATTRTGVTTIRPLMTAASLYHAPRA